MLWGMEVYWRLLRYVFLWVCWFPETQPNYCKSYSWNSLGTWGWLRSQSSFGRSHCFSQMQRWTTCLAKQETCVISQCFHRWRGPSLGNWRWIWKKTLWVLRNHVPGTRGMPEASPARRYFAICSTTSWWLQLDHWSGWVWWPPCFTERLGSWPWRDSLWWLQVCWWLRFEVPP